MLDVFMGSLFIHAASVLKHLNNLLFSLQIISLCPESSLYTLDTSACDNFLPIYGSFFILLILVFKGYFGGWRDGLAGEMLSDNHEDMTPAP